LILKKNNQAREWLLLRELLSDEECLLRRSITSDGRSKCFINGQPVTLQLLRELGHYLVNIHGQHEHQQLMQREAQRELLDAFAGHVSLVSSVRNLYKQWRELTDKLELNQQQMGDKDSRLAFLEYQVSEFEQLRFNAEELMHWRVSIKIFPTQNSALRITEKILQCLEE
jgi:DNA repair protein RecN (Recombination protein N)